MLLMRWCCWCADAADAADAANAADGDEMQIGVKPILMGKPDHLSFAQLYNV